MYAMVRSGFPDLGSIIFYKIEIMVLLMGLGLVQLEVCMREHRSGDGTRWLGRLKEVYSVCKRIVTGTVCLLGYSRPSRYPYSLDRTGPRRDNSEER